MTDTETVIESTPPNPSNSADKETNTWALIMHLSLLAGFLVPLAGLIAPVAIYLIKKNDLPGLVPHGHVIFNWIVSVIIYCIIVSKVTCDQIA